MEVPVLFVVLSFCVNSGHGAPRVNSISGNQTWHQASNDSSCSMIGLNLTGEIEEYVANITGSIAWDTHQKAWIGAYAKRVWVNFDGCYFGRFKSNDSWLTLTSPGDPTKTCLKHCDFRTFVLTDGKCVCYKDVKDFTTTGCIAKECSDTKYTYCGKGNATNSNNVTFHCMCRFSKDNNPSYISDKGGDCLAVHYTPQQHLISRNCRNTYIPICYNSTANQVDLSRGQNIWLQSLSECYLNNKQFASRTTNLTEPHYGTYWVGTFAVDYKEWGRPGSAGYSCVAVSIDRTNNDLTTVVLPCDTLLPALCFGRSFSAHITKGTITIGISTPRTTPAPITTGTTSNLNSHFPVSAIVGSVVGTVVILIIITLVIFWRRGVFRKTQNANSNKESDELEMRSPSAVDHTDTDKSTRNDVYNHLGEIKTKHNMFGDDLYDHTGADGDTYGHLNKERYDEDSEYDHTMNHTVSDTYGHLNTSYLHDEDNEYDHTSTITSGKSYGRLNRNVNQLYNENDYDHTSDMYSHLQAGKYHDVGDDVYDHTGGSGNMYGHVNISQPNGNSEYGHI